jgi:hypothetical protein
MVGTGTGFKVAVSKRHADVYMGSKEVGAREGEGSGSKER